MTSRRTHPAGFSLVELMVVVAIVAILASIALPAFTNLRLRTNRSEVSTISRAMCDAEQAYKAEWDTYTYAPNPCPYVLPSREKHSWEGCPNLGPFVALGFVADGATYGRYKAFPHLYGLPVDEGITCGAATDLDGDGVWQQAGFVLPGSEFAHLAPHNVY